MANLSNQRGPAWRTASIVVLAAAGIASIAPVAGAQYYYQPAPDYYQNDTAGGTFLGGALGAVSGAIIGGRSDRGEGALIGAGVGAVAGNLLGRQKDRADEQQAAVGAAGVARANQQLAAQAVTNLDLVQMTQAGVSEELIVSTMRSRGARLDLSPSSLISLKQSGVSDRVVLAAQEMAPGRSVAVAPAPIVTHAVPSTVIVTPVHRRYYRYHHPHYHHHHRHYGRHGSRVHVGVRF